MSKLTERLSCQLPGVRGLVSYDLSRVKLKRSIIGFGICLANTWHFYVEIFCVIPNESILTEEPRSMFTSDMIWFQSTSYVHDYMNQKSHFTSMWHTGINVNITWFLQMNGSFISFHGFIKVTAWLMTSYKSFVFPSKLWLLKKNSYCESVIQLTKISIVLYMAICAVYQLLLASLSSS